MQILRHLSARLRRDERGLDSAEFVILAPLFGIILGLLIAGGRLGLADINAQGAASAAARAASLAATATAAQGEARAAAQSQLASAGISCAPLDIAVDAGGLNTEIGEAGTVSVQVTCTVPLGDLLVPGLPGTRTIAASASSPIDPYKERG